MNKTHLKYIAEGRCPYCGGDKGEFYACERCRKQHSESLKRIRARRKAEGMCPRCGKNELWGDERQCLECTAKGYEIAMKRDREHYNKVHREWAKKTHAEFIKKGICTRCRKREATEGYKTCSVCRAKGRRFYQEKYSKIRPKGICVWCDKPVKKGMKVCEDHWLENIRKANLPQTKEARKEIQKRWY